MWIALLLFGCTTDLFVQARPPAAPEVGVGPVREPAPGASAGSVASQPRAVEHPDLPLLRELAGVPTKARDRLAPRGVQGLPTGFHTAPIDRTTSNAREAWASADGRLRRERFDLGPQAHTPIADFLFVLDPSVSMGGVIEQVRAAFLELAKTEVFPAGARVGVISTTPADPEAPGLPHPGVAAQGLPIHLDPGFQTLVRRDGIQRYRNAVAAEAGSAFRQSGCTEGWFTPAATDVHNVPCLLGATQTSLAPVGVEAGLTAVHQWVLGADDAPRFREGAAVHVIFVSDTHDPGVGPSHPWFDALEAMRPSGPDLVAAIEAQQVVADVRLHAIVPMGTCGERRTGSRSYAKAVQSTGGELLDLCEATTYVPFVQQLAEQGGRMRTPVLLLGERAPGALVVAVDGKPVAHSVTGSGRGVVLDVVPKRATEAVVAWQAR